MTLPKKPPLRGQYAISPVIYWCVMAVMAVIAGLILWTAGLILWTMDHPFCQCTV